MSFRHAARGVSWLIVHEPNARIHLVATATVLGLGIWLEISWAGWGGLAAAMGAVWIAEAFNTAIEQLADEVDENPNERIGRCKDLAAGAVLMTAICAATIGVIVLGPPLWRFLS